ncbi:MAG: hypothetical protein K2X03_06675 [Bryobacteraceae bacterium]|nr:hypothetical protein [Bryobacteraceae bacterium]
MENNKFGPRAGCPPRDREVGDEELPKPQSCRLVGLECLPCIQQSAANLASICAELSPNSLRDSFFKIYPDLACTPMARAFSRAYRAAQNAPYDAEEEEVLSTP